MQTKAALRLLPREGACEPYTARFTDSNAVSFHDPTIILGCAQKAREKLITYRDLYGFALQPARLFFLLCEHARAEAEGMEESVQSAADLIETTILRVATGATDPPLLPCCVPCLSNPLNYYQKQYQCSRGNQARSSASFQILRCLQDDDPVQALRQEIIKTLFLRNRFASPFSADPMTLRRHRYYTSLCTQYVSGISVWLHSVQQGKVSSSL